MEFYYSFDFWQCSSDYFPHFFLLPVFDVFLVIFVPWKALIFVLYKPRLRKIYIFTLIGRAKKKFFFFERFWEKIILMGSSGLVKKTNGYLGVTEPISWSGPSEVDVLKTQELEKVASFCSLWLNSVWCAELIGHLYVCDVEIGLLADQFLSDAGLYESQEEAVSREEVLGRLDQVSLAWYLLWPFFWSSYLFICCIL